MIETGPCMNTYVLTGTYQTHMLSVNRPQHYFFCQETAGQFTAPKTTSNFQRKLGCLLCVMLRRSLF